MDSPHGAPEASSPLVLLSASSQFAYPIPRPEVAAATTTRTSTIHPGINHPPRTCSIPAVATPPSAIRATNPFIVGLGAARGNSAAAVAGATTRSRKRSHSSTRERTTEISAAPPLVSAPSRKRKNPSSATKGSRSKKINACDRKKPPPGSNFKKPPPVAASEGGNDDAGDKKPAAVVHNCCICMSDVEPNDLAGVNGCDHKFCFGCIEKWSERENKCPLCKARFTKIERVQKKRKTGIKNTKKVKQRDQRSDLGPGTALEGLIANLNRNSGSLARIIFGGFDLGATSITGLATGRTANPIRSFTAGRSESADDETDEDDTPMAAIMRALHGSSVANGMRMSTTVMRPVTVTARFSTTTRSFARNLHDSTAGNGADNPLEIDDDSVISVEEVIEID